MALEQLAYCDGDTALTGWLARPVGAARGAVLVLPTIMNPNPPMERRAAMLAEDGFLAMVADFYGEPVRDFEHSMQLAGALRASVDGYRARLRAGLDTLTSQPDALGLKAAAIGYCMGGEAALELARDGADIVLAASFHGILTANRPAAPGAIKARILVCHGDADPLVPRSQVTAFGEEMDAAGANWHFHSYAGVKHGFTDPGSDGRGVPAIGYDASADRQSWAALTGLFAEVF